MFFVNSCRRRRFFCAGSNQFTCSTALHVCFLAVSVSGVVVVSTQIRLASHFELYSENSYSFFSAFQDIIENNPNDELYQRISEKFDSSPLYFTRSRGLFRECYPGDKTKAPKSTTADEEAIGKAGKFYMLLLGCCQAPAIMSHIFTAPIKSKNILQAMHKKIRCVWTC